MEVFMKKLAVLFVLFCIVGGVNLFAQDTYTVDLSGLTVKNPTAFPRQYDYHIVSFDNLPADVNWSRFNRVIVRVKFYGANGDEIRQAHGLGITSMYYERNPDNPHSPEIFDGANRNVPLKTDNIGLTGPGAASQDNGIRISLNRAPGGIVLQNGNARVAFIELVELTFFRR
jgi:hypothetical protein